LLLLSCGHRKEAVPVPTARDLRPYDFVGRTGAVLARLCRAAPHSPASRRAASLLLCARTALDWYLVASLREDPALATALERMLAAQGVLPPGATPVGARILLGLERLFARAAAAARGASLRRSALAGQALVRLQRQESPRWRYTYLQGLYEAARPGAPWAVQAQVIVLGAALDALRTATRSALPRRGPLLIQGVGFPCPAEAEAARRGEAAPVRPPSCPLACPGLRDMVSRLPPARRKTLIAAQCPLAHLGIAQRAHGAYLSRDNHVLFRVVSFLTRIATWLQAARQDPLVAALDGARRRLAAGLARLRVPLYYPELSPGEPVTFPLAFCASADEPAQAPVYLALDETRLYAGPRPLLGVVNGAPVPLDQHAGFPFPGQPLGATDPTSLADRLATLRKTYAQTLGHPVDPKTLRRVTLYADARLSGGRLNDLLDLLTAAKISAVEILARNRAGQVRAASVHLALRRRSEGPPLPPRPAGSGPTSPPIQRRPGSRCSSGPNASA
jgi:hypothetical protein